MRRSLFGLFLIALFGFSCQREPSFFEHPTYAAHYDSTKYVGIETCVQCHPKHGNTFKHTGMGLSFDSATPEKSVLFGKSPVPVYDSILGAFFQTLWRGDSLWIKEFRIEGKDTVYQRLERVAYVIGSGQHTNSHLWEEKGYLHQAPYTYYTQSKKADLPPGFESGNNSRFSRLIGLECMSCHNALPRDFVLGSENKFRSVPQGIDCERCHGPGGTHVQKIQKGIITDTSLEIDYSIVNPAKLSVDLQMEICQRCHLQGNPVLQEGKSFFDFKPGMTLSEVMDVYVPIKENPKEEMIMASHVERFKMSACYINAAESFNCISCHNPHKTVQSTSRKKFNQPCLSCHPNQNHQTQIAEDIVGDCVSCHMPSSGSSDIPHVSVHDHWIQIPSSASHESGNNRLLGLKSVNNPNPTIESKVLGYLHYYERFEANPLLLDSANFLLSTLPLTIETLPYFVYSDYLKGDFITLRNRVQKLKDQRVLQALNIQSYDNFHGWTSYRIGEAFYANQDFGQAKFFWGNAIKLAPYILDFHVKYANVQMKLEEWDAAFVTLENAKREFPGNAQIFNNLGYLNLLKGNTAKAQNLFEEALSLNPDYEQALLNRVNVVMMQGNWALSAQYLKELLKKYPENEGAKLALDQVHEKLKEE